MRLLVNAAAFGLGSAGKAASILAELPKAEVVVYGSELGAPVFDDASPVVGRVPSGAPLSSALDLYAPDAALVVLEPTVASELVGLGCRVVYVDSLPFIRSSPDEVPAEVDVYLAQQTPALPASCWSALRAVTNLRWIGAILPRLPAPAIEPPVEADVVVNLGGLVSTLREANDISYPAIVLPPVLDALASEGYRSVVVTTSAAAVPCVSALMGFGSDLEIRVCALSHREFGAILRAVPLLLTSPGLTTLLEGGRLGVPMIVLPPQNLTQCLNAATVTIMSGGDRCVRWPAEVLDLSTVERLQQSGEMAAVQYIYGVIDACRDRTDVYLALRTLLTSALRTAPTNPASALVELIGENGAAQVAEAIRSCVHEPGPISSRRGTDATAGTSITRR